MSIAYRFLPLTAFLLLSLLVSGCGGGGGGGSTGAGSDPQPPTLPVIASGTVGPAGGMVSDPWGETAVLVPPGSLASSALIEIRQGRDSSGYVTTTISSSVSTTAPVSVLFPPPAVVENSVPSSSANQSSSGSAGVAGAVIAAASAYPITTGGTNFVCPSAGYDAEVDWYRRCSYFNNGKRNDSLVTPTPLTAGSTPSISAPLRPAAFLSSYCNFSDLQCYVGKTPVLFVHGYIMSADLPLGFGSDNGFGGGERTWGKFPDEIRRANADYVPFEFRWVTNARFADVAVDLGRAIEQISQRTGKKVHVIGHSFGGVLARVYLQGLAEGYPYKENVATLTTLGSPHAGIFNQDYEVDLVPFKDGQDGKEIDLCLQISCYEMGKVVPGMGKMHGETAAKIYWTRKELRNVEIQVLLGLTTSRDSNDSLDEGDGLITYEGQRFLAFFGDSEPLAKNLRVGNAFVTESILGTDAETRPGNANPFGGGPGYRHNTQVGPDDAAPMVCIGIGCKSGREGTYHHGVQKALSWISTWISNAAIPDVEIRTTFLISGTVKDASTGAPLQDVQVILTDGPPGVNPWSPGTATDGSFSLETEFVPNSLYEFSFYKRGYEKAKRAITSTQSPPSGALGQVTLVPITSVIPPKTYTLTVDVSGSGAVTGTGGVSCPSACTVDFREGEQVALTALPYENLGFDGWSGCDTATGTACRITMNGNKSITATFGAPLPTAPAAPNIIQASALSASKVLLVWQDQALSESGFRVERKIGTGGTYAPITTRAALAGNGSWAYYEDVSVSAGTQYCYMVIAYDAATNESISNPEACATIPPSGGPSGGQIVFRSSRDGNAEIYIMNGDGTGQSNLTNNPFLDIEPAWSPDGTKIAFASSRDGNREIYVMNADGSGLVRLTNNSVYDGEPVWSPNGTKIAFVSDPDGNFLFEIYIMNADGTGQTRLTNNSAYDSSPDWSPDGFKIAFSSNRDGNTGVYVMNADGSGQSPLSGSTPGDVDPAWSPDGTRIAFGSSSGGQYGIFTMNADGSGRARLTTNAETDREPAWSPDGAQIAFTRQINNSTEIYIMNADGTGQTRLTTNLMEDTGPVWRPIP